MNITIDIDLDKKCKRCGKKGTTTKGGLCLRCIGMLIAAKAGKK